MKVYHSTKKENVPQILKEGLKINSGVEGFTMEGKWSDKYYGCRPVYVSLVPNVHKGEVVLEVDVDALDLKPDLPTLLCQGAYLEEDDGCIWFEEGETPEGLLDYESEGGSIYIEDLTERRNHIRAIRETNTAVVCRNIPPENIKVLM